MLPAWTVVEPLPIEELLADYQAAEVATGIDWYWLAAIHLQETRMGRIIGTSSAGAVGPMQFLPSTWAQCCHGDPTVTGDAIIGAATYLMDNGGRADMQGALHAYNPSDTYVATVTAFAENLRDNPKLYAAYHAVAGLLQHRRRAPSACPSGTAQRNPSTPRPTLPAIPKTPAEYGGRMADLLEISSRIIDSGVVDQPVNRVTQRAQRARRRPGDRGELQPLRRLRQWRRVGLLRCIGGAHRRRQYVAALRGWRPDRVGHLVYTHGHADHVGGSTLLRRAMRTDRRRPPQRGQHGSIGTTSRTTGTSSSTPASSAAYRVS